MLAVDGVYPSIENIENGTYPLINTVYMVTLEDNTDPNIQKLRDFILSEDGQKIVRENGYAGLAENAN